MWTATVADTGNGNGGDAGDGADHDLALPAAVAGFAATATRDSLFANGSAAQLTVTIAGLDVASNYDLLFYGSRGNNGPTQTWSLTAGSGGADVSHGILDNTTTVVDWDNLSTNGSGVIAFTISGNSGSDGIGINFGQISQVPEPSALMLLGIAVGLVLLRRRRVA